MIAGMWDRVTGKADKPPDWLVEILASERLARTELEKKIDQVSADAQATTNLLAEQLTAQEARHAGEIARLEQLHRERLEAQEKLFNERLLGQREFIDYLERVGARREADAVAMHEAIGGLRQAKEAIEVRLTDQRRIADDRHADLSREIQTRQREAHTYYQIALELDAEVRALDPTRPSRMAATQQILVPPPVVSREEPSNG